MPYATASKGGRVVFGRVVVLPSLRRACLTIENVGPDPGGSSTLPLPRYFDASAVVEQRPTGRVWRWIDQQVSGYCACRYPPVSIAWPVTFAITPPRELTRRLFATLIDNGAWCPGKMTTARAVEYRPADRDHAEATLPPCFPIQRKRETVMFRFQVFSLTGGRE